jgi:hypothetical protein
MRVVRSFGLQLLWCLSALGLAGCSAWQPLAGGLGPTRPAKLPYALRVTRIDGSRSTLLAPFVRGDSLHARVLRDTLSMPLDEVQRVEQDRFSVTRSAALVLAVPVAFLLAYAIHCRDNRCSPQY